VLEGEPEFLSPDQEHQHDQSVGSVGLRFTGGLLMQKVEDLVQSMLKDKGTDLFRYKGVLDVKGAPNKYIFQVGPIRWVTGPSDQSIIVLRN
jgi:G3E family GTPase